MNFGKIFSGVWQDNQSVLGIDIGSSSAKVVQLKKKKGRAILETYGELSLGPYADLAIGQAVTLSTDKTALALKDLFREASVTGKIAAISLPLRSSLLKVIELPAYKEEQINHMVPIEARKYIPVPISEVTLDWWAIPKKDFQGPDEENTSSAIPTGHTEVLLVAIHKAAVKKFQDITTAMNLDSRTFEIETFSSMRSVLARDISAMALLDVGAGTSKLTIVDYGVVRVSHVINKGAQDLTMAISNAGSIPFADAEKLKRKEGLGSGNAGSILDFIFFEANTVIEEYQKKYARLVSKVICTGGGAVMKNFVTLAQKHFQAEVTLGEPFDKVEAPAFLSDILKQAGPEFAVALGLALHELEEV
ncbi:MAG TPA: pilus assembly protein PilM [Candidatus Paceibacterota bacterium]